MDSFSLTILFICKKFQNQKSLFMKKIALTFCSIFMFIGIVNSQTIPIDSLYLGQTKPSNTPKIFNLPVTNGLRPVERITITSDGKEIYYGEQDSWPASIFRVKCIKYENNKWQPPTIVFENYVCPSLANNDSIMFLQRDIITYYSQRTDTGWTKPQRLLSTNNQAHYFQEGLNKNYYMASDISGNSDLCKLVINNNDTIIHNLGKPINTSITENDFYISKDDSFMIIFRYTNPNDLYISYNKGNGIWTNPKSLGLLINTSGFDCSPFVTKDKKYMFFTRGGGAMSTYYTYWVKIDNTIDSLKHTNYPPFVNKVIPNQTGNVGQSFNYTMPDSLFIDDDGNNTLTYSAKLSNGAALPTWLTFDASTGTFSGVPDVVKTYTVSLTAKDTANATINTSFKITIGAASEIDEENKDCFKIYPNPTTDVINIVLNENVMGSVEISNMVGDNILSKTINGKCCIDMQNQPKGNYIVKLKIDENVIIKKVLLQ